MELKKASAGVVEDSVQNDPNASIVSFVNHASQCLSAPEHGVDLLVVVRVISVIGGRLEHGREVDRGDAERNQVIEVLEDADQIAALIAVISGRCTPRVEVAGLRHRRAPREAIGENLVEDRVANPFGRLRIEHRQLQSIEVRIVFAAASSPCSANPTFWPDGHSPVAFREAKLSSGADPVPVKLLPVASHSQVIEHGLHVQLDLGLPAKRLAVDPDIGFSLEVDQLRAQPDIEPR